MASGPKSEPTEPSPGPSGTRAKPLFWVFLLGLVLAVVAASAASIWVYGQYTSPGPLLAEKVLVIRKGAGAGAVAAQLDAARIIKSPLVFRLAARFAADQRPLRAGEYRFRPAMSMRQVLNMIVRGDIVLRRITLAEGLTTQEVFQIVAATGGLKGDIGTDPEEGVFLPETYYFSLGDSRDSVLKRMSTAMNQTLDALWQTRAPGLPIKSKREALILASIVEKETSIDNERKMIAGVFINRLRKGMRLQTDPTVIYGITGGKAPLGRPLRRSELKKATPYNTYVIVGLPPGPIANPGRRSIAAALDPAKTDYFYFVADGTGGHAFARTGKEHERNVAKWRRVQRQQKKKAKEAAE